MTQKDTIDIVAEATDLRRKLEETRIIAGYYRERMKDAESQMASMELTANLKALEPLMTPKKEKWIKTFDKMPDDGQPVIALERREYTFDGSSAESNVVSVMRYSLNGCCWIGEDSRIARRPLCWMPLPPLPEEGK